MKKYYYEIDFSAVMCFFQIKINDVELISMNLEGQTRSEFPINQLILESGEQNIEVIALPIEGKTELHKDSYVRYRVNVFDMSTGDYVFVKQMEEYSTPKVSKKTPIIGHKSSFIAEVPYVLDAWQKSLNLKDSNLDIKEMLIIDYQKIINDIHSKNYSSFLEKYSKREKNNAISMYLSLQEAEDRVKKLIQDFNEGFEPIPINKNVVVEYSAYGKLVCLKSSDLQSSLRLENKETDENLILPITFHIPEDKEGFEVI